MLFTGSMKQVPHFNQSEISFTLRTGLMEVAGSRQTS
jgi:hypothetical protein